MAMVVLTRSQDMRGLSQAPVRRHPYPPAQARIDQATTASGGWDRMQIRGLQGVGASGLARARGVGQLDMEAVKTYAPWAIGGLVLGVGGVLLFAKRKKRRR